jgi:hypothetical protein
VGERATFSSSDENALAGETAPKFQCQPTLAKPLVRHSFYSFSLSLYILNIPTIGIIIVDIKKRITILIVRLLEKSLIIVIIINEINTEITNFKELIILIPILYRDS